MSDYNFAEKKRFYAIFAYICPSKMRRRSFLVLLLLFIVVVATVFFFGKRCNRVVPDINVDSLFINLNDEIAAKRANQADKVFTGLNKAGLNGVVLYAEQGRVVYEKAFGWRDLSKRQKDSLRVDDAFQLSSDSKMFTAEAIMLLKAEGKLDYDDDVRKYIPQLPYEGVTIRHLLNHRSGLPRYDAMADQHWPDRKKPFSNEAMIKMLAEKKPEPYGTPDGSYFYNNINYALLATVVERASGQHFEDFMRERIFEPLDMSHSYIYSMRNDTLVSLYMPVDAHGHDLFEDAKRLPQRRDGRQNHVLHRGRPLEVQPSLGQACAFARQLAGRGLQTRLARVEKRRKLRFRLAHEQGTPWHVFPFRLVERLPQRHHSRHEQKPFPRLADQYHLQLPARSALGVHLRHHGAVA